MKQPFTCNGLILFWLVWCLSFSTAANAEPVLLSDEIDQYPLGLKIELLEDKQASWTLQQVLSPELAEQFVISTSSEPSFGYTDSAYWVKFRVKSQSLVSKKWLLEVGDPMLDDIEVSIIETDATGTNSRVLKTFKAGDTRPFASREIEHLNFVFPLLIESQQTLTVVVRAKGQDSMHLPLTLLSGQKLMAQSNTRVLLLGLYCGVMLVMMLYNMFIYLSVRDKSYLYYVLYIIFFGTGVLSVNGLSNQYLWPNSVWLANHVFPIFIAAATGWALLFSQHFLGINAQSPYFYRLFRVMQWWMAILAVASIVLSPSLSTMLVLLSDIPFLILLMTAGAYSLKQGYRPAQYFLLAWLGMVLGGGLAILYFFGLIPSHFITRNSAQMGSALEVVLLSFALADRINLLQKEANDKDRQARENALIAQKNAELAQQNAELATENAEKANQAKSIFIANISHEIRTPLNAVLGYTQMLSRVPALAQQHKQQLNIIEKSGNHLLALINDILDISKIEANSMALQQMDFELVDLAAGIAVIVDGRCEEKQLKWQFINQTHDHIPVYGDQGKLRQILINLLGNAVKFTDEGTVTLKLSRDAPDRYRFEVIDTGVGIAPESQLEIFNAFGQTVEGSRHGGTGLGLAIATRQVALMGGQLQVESTPGKGSRFFFTIPLPAARAPIESRHNRQVKAIKLAQGVNITALVVDDIKGNRDILSQMLEDAGIVVTSAHNGQVALDKLHQAETLPDLIFMDIRMPVMDGEQALQQIKQDFKENSPICIVVTAHAMQANPKYYLDQGFAHYIAKPFRFEAIYDCIHRLLAVDFEYLDEVDDTADNSNGDFSDLCIPIGLHQTMTDAAEGYEVTKLEACLIELADLSTQGKGFAGHLKQYVSSYNMDDLLLELEKINRQ